MKFRVSRTIQYVRSLPWYYSWGGALVVALLLFMGVRAALRSSSPTASAPAQTSHVSIASVASLAAQAQGPLPVTGTVTSLNHASILAQSSGEVTVLSRSIGDYVPAGGIIGQLENSSQRAAVLQAQGSYDAAEATFKNTSGTTATNSGITATQATQALANAQTNLHTALQSLFAALDDAVHTKADLLFSQPRNNPILQLTVPDNQLVITLQNERTQLDITLADVSAISRKTTLNEGDVAQATADAQLVVTFLNNLAEAVNKAIPGQAITASQISGYQTSIGTARTSVSTALSGVVTAKGGYDSAVATAASTSNTAQGGTQNSISIAQANVEQAQGTLAVAQAALEKTIIRSPISGTIVSLPINRGDYVSISQQVADVSNPSALEVDVYVTPDDAKTIAVGGSALISNSVKGTIVSIAPALDPTTGKILVKIGIVGDQTALTDGETVTVSLTRATAGQTRIVKGTASSTILIPIVAAKITPEGPVVFTVGPAADGSASSTVTQLPITLGTILGDKVIVLTGLTPDMIIVEDARGLSNGQKVVVDSH